MSRSKYHEEFLRWLVGPLTPRRLSKALASFIAATMMSCVAVFAATAAELKCPDIGELENPPLGTTIEDLLPQGLALQQPDKLAFAASLMREHGFSSINAINHLVALYCPSIASAGNLSTQDKIARVRDFAHDATKAVFAGDDIDGIIFDVPLSPNLAEQVKELAANAGMSVDEWIANVVADSARHQP